MAGGTGPGTLRDHQEQKASEDEELNELVMLGPILQVTAHMVSR